MSFFTIEDAEQEMNAKFVTKARTQNWNWTKHTYENI